MTAQTPQSPVPPPYQAPQRPFIPPEPKIEMYLRHIRAWLAVIGIIMLIGVAGGIIIGINAAHSSQVNSDCQSQGGTVPDC
jgi:hypothetical protein